MKDEKEYSLLEVINFPVGTDVELLDWRHIKYKINKKGQLIPQIYENKEPFPVSKENIENSKFKLLEHRGDYNFRVYIGDKLIRCFKETYITEYQAMSKSSEISNAYIFRYCNTKKEYLINDLKVVFEEVVDEMSDYIK